MNKELDYGYFVTTEHDLGTVVATPTQSLEFGVIIPRNMNLPASSTEIYSPVVDNQESLNFKVIEGDANQPLSAEDNVVLAETTISIPNPAPMDEVSFSVSYTYDENGILVFGVTDNRDESQLHAGEIALGIQKDREKMVKIAQKTTKTLDENKVQKETLTDGGDSELNSEITTLLLNARTKVAPFVDDEEATIIRELCQKVEDSSGNDQDSVVKLNEIIDKYFYLF